jgi:hypothetical protein
MRRVILAAAAGLGGAGWWFAGASPALAGSGQERPGYRMGSLVAEIGCALLLIALLAGVLLWAARRLRRH